MGVCVCVCVCVCHSLSYLIVLVCVIADRSRRLPTSLFGCGHRADARYGDQQPQQPRYCLLHPRSNARRHNQSVAMATRRCAGTIVAGRRPGNRWARRWTTGSNLDCSSPARIARTKAPRVLAVFIPVAAACRGRGRGHLARWAGGAGRCSSDI